MKIKGAAFSISLLVAGAFTGAGSAKAANFTSNITYTDPTNDVVLNSITQNGTVFSDFSFVDRTIIQYNTPRTSNPNSGAASTDRGDNVSTPRLPAEAPDNEAITAFLGTDNLNNIIDTEDVGSFKIDVFFEHQIRQDNSGLDSLFFWERGMNSDLGIQALDANGNVIGNYKKITETRFNSNFAGFNINTGEIGSAQRVGSWGINLDELGVSGLSGLRLTADETFNGPDFKVIARGGDHKAKVPEPTTILGLGAVAGMTLLRRRQKMQHN
ncbi:MAG: PEP-CTERM sorting domain-containing protein [Sphaerospermopsis sp. SIO1G1]|nr:PEP-CTERM sorting domain-containing protein [Sphaerospermopsis sp. SIO1G1]